MMSHDRTSNDTYDNSVDITPTQPSALQIWSVCFSVLNNFLLLATLAFVCVTWKKVTPWRQFKNYTFANLIVAQFLFNVSNIAFYSDWPCFNEIADLFYKTSLATFCNWTLICFIVIYTKMVKVFSGDLQHPYLKANAFAWGLSLIESVISTYVICPAVVIITFATSYVVCGFYISIVRSLLKLLLTRMVSRDNSQQIIRIFLYVSSAFTALALMQVIVHFPDHYDHICLVICVLQLVLMGSFLCMKMHREMWDEYLMSNSHQKDVAQSAKIMI